MTEPLTPPTTEAAVWAQTTLATARNLRQQLVRLTLDHYRELTPVQQADLTAVRRQATTTVLVLSALARQLEEAIGWTPTLNPEDIADALATAHAPAHTEEDEARADIDYDNTVNAF